MSRSIRASFALAALAAAAFSSAVQQTQSFTFASTTTNWDKDLNFNQFDGSLGTLTGYTLTFTWTGALSGSAINGSEESNLITINHSLQFDLTDKAISTFYMANKSVLGTTYSETLAPEGTLGSSGSYATGTKTGSFGVDDLDLSFFMGSGITDLNLYAHGETDQTTNGDSEIHVDTQAGVVATLTYDYTPSGSTPAVPAPPAFMAMGLGALRLARRRRAARA